MTRRFAKALIWLGITFLSACGGGGSLTAPMPTPATGIMNGATHASATSHWESTNCTVKVEVTTDHAAWTSVTTNKGTTSSGSETWSPGATQNTMLIGPGNSGLGGFFWVSGLASISGSTASSSFSATVTVESGTTSQVLGTCSFALAQHPLS
jgi:hypothetical protein